MGRMSEEWAEQQSQDQVLDAEYAEWVSGLADMEAERHGSCAPCCDEIEEVA